MDALTHIDLFSGIGGFTLACEWAGIQTEVFCEKDEKCQEFLRRTYPGIPIVSDIREFDGSKWRGRFLLTAGVPCQPASRAGKQGGKADDRWLWPDAIRVVSEARPDWVLFENPLGINDVGLDGILADLEGLDYEVAPPLIIPACAVNSPQLRNRYWIVANAQEQRLEGRSNGSEGQPTEGSGFLPAGSSESYLAHRDERGSKDGQCMRSDVSRCDQGEDCTSKYIATTSERCQSHLADTGEQRCRPRRAEPEGQQREDEVAELDSNMGKPNSTGYEQGNQVAKALGHGYSVESTDLWSRSVWLTCADGKLRRAPDDSFGVVDGLHRSILAGLGNSIVPQVAYEIIKAILITTKKEKDENGRIREV